MTDANSNDNAAPTDGTGAGMMAWFAWMIAKHEVTENTASGLRTGVKNVITIDDDWEEVDMVQLDLENQIQRFRNARRGTLSDNSVDEYARRFRVSTESYRKWLDNEKDWYPAKSRPVGSAPRKPVSKKPKTEPRQYDIGVGSKATLVSPTQQDEQVEPVKPEGVEVIRYTVPLRSGDDAVLQLPRELTPADARRVSRVIASLAMDDEDEDDQPPRPVRAIEA